MVKHLALWIFIIQLPCNVQAAEYNFVSVENVAEQEVGRIVLTEIYQQMGIKITISPFSAKRAEYEANKGSKDGETMRIWAYGEDNENLIRIPTPYYHIATTAFINKEAKLVLNNEKDIANYRIARVRGFKHTKAITKGMNFVLETNSTTNSFKLLEQGTVDIALADYIDGIWTLSTLDIEHNIIAYPKPLARLYLYHYLHKKHQHLVEKVDNKIKEMVASGELDTIIQKAQHHVFGDIAIKYNFTPLKKK